MVFGRPVATRVLGCSPVNHALRLLARLRGHCLVLVYHRVSGPNRQTDCEIVPSVPVELFRTQMQALKDVVEIVPIDELLREGKRAGTLPARRRPEIAVTFDDDLPSHVSEALPVLTELGVPATFFLSGRALHGLGAYWFQQLETLLVVHGKSRTAALLGMASTSAADLALACERNATVRKRVFELSTDLQGTAPLQAAGIAALAAARMTIGFHTLEHDVLTELEDAALQEAVSRGRDQLAHAAGTAVRYFAYPHGKVNAHAAAAVRQAGFEAAFTGRPEPVREGGDPYSLGRWEPGPLAVDDLLVKLVVRLHCAGPAAPLA